MILLDGATGTRLWTLAGEARVEKYATWRYNVEHPEFVTRAQREYIEAGSQMILTNTFSANAPEIAGLGGYTAPQVVAGAVAAAREAARGTEVKVALDIGPLTELLEPYGELEPEQAADIFAEQLDAGVAAGADAVFIETFMDLEMMKLAAAEALKHALPVLCSMSFAKGGRTMFGNSVKDVVAALEPMGVAAVGLNCSLGPALAAPIIREFREYTELPLIFKPNAGMPRLSVDGSEFYDCSPEAFAAEARQVFDCVSYIGGCCGTDARYIKALKSVRTTP